jgi:uncharacterized protein DUF4326
MSVQRIQRKRTKGWRMPPNTVYVGRGSRYGNPWRLLNEEGFPLIEHIDGRCVSVPDDDWDAAEQKVVDLFREQCLDGLPLAPLRGKNLACWCGIGKPCHADALLEIANK